WRSAPSRDPLETSLLRPDHHPAGDAVTPPLAPRTVARVALLEPGEADRREGGARAGEVTVHRERDLLVGALAYEVAPGVLRQVAGTARPLDQALARLQEAGGDFGERRLAGSVRPGQRDDLAATKLDARALQAEEPARGRDRHVPQP